MKSLAELPVDSYLQRISSVLHEHGCVVIAAAPGAGKTTRVPPAILDGEASGGKQLLLLQPRRVAARAAAARIAEERGWKVGKEVGYQVRFENRTSRDSRLVVLTEGILTRRLQSDPFLENVFCVVLDEFHERSIHTDLALAMLQEIRSSVRPDLQLVVMSATLSAEPISNFLGGAPVVEIPGRMFPVEIDHMEQDTGRPLVEKTAAAVNRVVGRPASETGHVLVFLPGMREIRHTQEQITPGAGDVVHILHSSVAAEAQDAALAPCLKRKLILATNLAETSLTIDGVQTVIDSGYERVPLLDQRLGIDRLELRRISKASTAQRAGRAGRTAPGKCLRLWSSTEHAVLDEHPVPEILRTDLAPTLLSLKAYGTPSAADFRWFEPPREADVLRAERLLTMLGATDQNGRLTDLGRKLADIPAHPRIGRLIVAGLQMGIAQEAAAVGASLSEGAMSRRTGRQAATHAGTSDLLDCLQPHPDPFVQQQLRRVKEHLLRAMEQKEDSGRRVSGWEELLRKAVFLAYPDRLTVRRSHDKSRGVMVGSRGVFLDASSTVREARLFVSIDPSDPSPNAGGRPARDYSPGESRVSLASAVEEPWLRELLPFLLEIRDEVEYDPVKDRLLVFRRQRFAGLLFDERITGGNPKEGTTGDNPLVTYLLEDEEKLRTFLEARPETLDWLSRLQFLAAQMPGLGCPSPAIELLRSILEQALYGKTSLAGVRDGELLRSVKNGLPHAVAVAVEREAPRTFLAPSGSSIRIEYPILATGDGEKSNFAAPTASVRLQELFGLRESPRVAGGRVAVVLHLLSPGFRPVQVTTDLKSFWSNTYAEVRKELRGRYPKHPWPENPMEAPAVAIGRRRR